jgi:hypothetical protein
MFHTKVVEKIKTHFVFSNFFFENRAVYEIMWKNSVVTGRPQVTIWRMRIACWIPKAINTHSEQTCVILIDCPLQKRLQVRAWMLRYTYIACLVLLIMYVGNWSRGAANVTVVKFGRAKWGVPVDGTRKVENLGCTGFGEESWW